MIQHDHCTEFDGAVSRLYKQLQIKVIKGRPYHPQSQGKVERAHRIFKKKLRYDFLSIKKAGVNWPEGLPHYAQALNQDPKEELAWKSPFEIYLGRRPSVAPHLMSRKQTSGCVLTNFLSSFRRRGSITFLAKWYRTTASWPLDWVTHFFSVVAYSSLSAWENARRVSPSLCRRS